MKNLKLIYFPNESNEENDPVTLNFDDEIEIENELSQEAYSNVDDEEKEEAERNSLTTHNDQLNNSEDERELRKKRRIKYSSTSNNIHQQTELV